MSNIVNLLPVILVAVGALVTLAAEPFIKDDNKHKVLPWVASLFVVLGAGAYYLTTNDTFMNLYAMDPIRRVLGIAIVLCAFQQTVVKITLCILQTVGAMFGG